MAKAIVGVKLKLSVVKPARHGRGKLPTNIQKVSQTRLTGWVIITIVVIQTISGAFGATPPTQKLDGIIAILYQSQAQENIASACKLEMWDGIKEILISKSILDVEPPPLVRGTSICPWALGTR
jgi:hypothetical protein